MGNRDNRVRKGGDVGVGIVGEKFVDYRGVTGCGDVINCFC